MTRRAAKPTSTGSSQFARAGTRLRLTAIIVSVSRQTGWMVISPPMPLIVSGRATSPMSGLQKVGSISPSSSICIAAASWAGLSATG